jgi:hypothetical protein
MVSRIVLSVNYEDFVGEYLGKYESDLSDEELVLKIIKNMKEENKKHMIATNEIDGGISFFILDDDGSNYIAFSPYGTDRSEGRLVNIPVQKLQRT